MGVDEDAAELLSLRESVARLRTLLEHAPVMIDSFDDAGNCLLWNRECERRLGWTQQEIIEMEDPLAVCYPDPEVRAAVLDAIKRADGTYREYSVIAKDGSTRIQEWADFRLPTGALISVGHDVTEQRSVQLQLRQSQKMDAVGQLTGGIAHDFNNLLTVIVANAEVLTEGLSSGDARLREATRQISDAASRGARLVRQLMSFSRQRLLTFEAVELTGLLEELAPTLQRVLPESIEIVMRCDTGPAHVRADPLALEQILVNLATNARDAIEGRGHITFEVSTEPGRPNDPTGPVELAVLSVTDDGKGMAAGVRDRAFEPFFTTKPAGEGTGLGMPTVYGLVEQHGGSVELSSREGRGTRVEIRIPSTGRPAETIDAPAEPAPAVRGDETILVVEDQLEVRRSVEMSLESLGYTVRVAANGSEAVEQLDAHPDVALVLSDVVMPVMTGPELLARVERREQAPAFAFMTGYAPRDAYDVGDRVPVIEKPWSLHELASFVRRCLDER